jgi:hypothetical protein
VARPLTFDMLSLCVQEMVRHMQVQCQFFQASV